MVKCTICKEKLDETFLSKPLGTALRRGSKILWVCKNCQREKTKEELEKLKA